MSKLIFLNPEHAGQRYELILAKTTVRGARELARRIDWLGRLSQMLRRRTSNCATD